MSLISIGVHSPKVTFSWARQIGVSEEARMSQGHHRASEARQNVALCGRDDVHAALDLQRQLVHRITSGFRSVIPLLRGGAKLLVDKPVNIRHTALDPCHMDTCLPDVADLADTDSDISNVGVGTTEDAPELTVQVANCCQCTALRLGYPRLRPSLRAHGWPCNQMWRFWGTRSTTNLGTTIDPPAQCLTRYRRCQRTLHHYG